MRRLPKKPQQFCERPAVNLIKEVLNCLLASLLSYIDVTTSSIFTLHFSGLLVRVPSHRDFAR